MAVPAVRRLVYLLVGFPLEPWNAPKHTGDASGSASLRIGETRCAPLLKSKSKLLLVSPIGIE